LHPLDLVCSYFIALRAAGARRLGPIRDGILRLLGSQNAREYVQPHHSDLTALVASLSPLGLRFLNAEERQLLLPQAAFQPAQQPVDLLCSCLFALRAEGADRGLDAIRDEILRQLELSQEQLLQACPRP
jgi:hypothetical protein